MIVSPSTNGFRTTPVQPFENGAERETSEWFVQTPPPRAFFPEGQNASLVAAPNPPTSTSSDTISYPLIPLGPALSSLQARLLELAPGRLMTRDNLASMQVDNVAPGPFPEVFGIQPVALESVAPGWLAPAAMHSRFDTFRAQSGR